jgi:ubiquinone/menaquinone biosynthesis C-methylase UbiE
VREREMNQKEKKVKYAALFARKSGIKLDVGCGDAKQKGFVGMDIRKRPGIDIVHDVQKFPWPIPSNSCHTILMSHLWEHIEPKNRLDLMNELFRVIQSEGQLLISAPYATSVGAFQDPTHYGCPNQNTFTYFDPFKGGLYNVYKIRPWKLVRNNYQMNGNMEVILYPWKTKSGKAMTLKAIQKAMDEDA